MLNRKVNYNLVVKLILIVTVIQIVSSISTLTFTYMFYQANKTVFTKIDINNCSFEALDSLGGIGDVKANRIIENRPYKDIYELKTVIGETTFNAIKNQIKADGIDD